MIEEGRGGDTDLSGLHVAVASSYSDDVEGSPWTVVLYVDERGSAEARQAPEQIFLGRFEGTQIEHFPWAWKPSNLVAVRPAQIEIDHTPRRQWFRVPTTARSGSSTEARAATRRSSTTKAGVD